MPKQSVKSSVSHCERILTKAIIRLSSRPIDKQPISIISSLNRSHNLLRELNERCSKRLTVYELYLRVTLLISYAIFKIYSEEAKSSILPQISQLLFDPYQKTNNKLSNSGPNEIVLRFLTTVLDVIQQEFPLRFIYYFLRENLEENLEENIHNNTPVNDNGPIDQDSTKHSISLFQVEYGLKIISSLYILNALLYDLSKFIEHESNGSVQLNSLDFQKSAIYYFNEFIYPYSMINKHKIIINETFAKLLFSRKEFICPNIDGIGHLDLVLSEWFSSFSQVDSIGEETTDPIEDINSIQHITPIKGPVTTPPVDIDTPEWDPANDPYIFNRPLDFQPSPRVIRPYTPNSHMNMSRSSWTTAASVNTSFANGFYQNSKKEDDNSLVERPTTSQCRPFPIGLGPGVIAVRPQTEKGASRSSLKSKKTNRTTMFGNTFYAGLNKASVVDSLKQVSRPLPSCPTPVKWNQMRQKSLSPVLPTDTSQSIKKSSKYEPFQLPSNELMFGYHSPVAKFTKLSSPTDDLEQSLLIAKGHNFFSAKTRTVSPKNSVSSDSKRELDLRSYVHQHRPSQRMQGLQTSKRCQDFRISQYTKDACDTIQREMNTIDNLKTADLSYAAFQQRKKAQSNSELEMSDPFTYNARAQVFKKQMIIEHPEIFKNQFKQNSIHFKGDLSMCYTSNELYELTHQAEINMGSRLNEEMNQRQRQSENQRPKTTPVETKRLTSNKYTNRSVSKLSDSQIRKQSLDTIERNRRAVSKSVQSSIISMKRSLGYSETSLQDDEEKRERQRRETEQKRILELTRHRRKSLSDFSESVVDRSRSMSVLGKIRDEKKDAELFTSVEMGERSKTLYISRQRSRESSDYSSFEDETPPMRKSIERKPLRQIIPDSNITETTESSGQFWSNYSGTSNTDKRSKKPRSYSKPTPHYLKHLEYEKEIEREARRELEGPEGSGHDLVNFLYRQLRSSQEKIIQKRPSLSKFLVRRQSEGHRDRLTSATRRAFLSSMVKPDKGKIDLS